MYCTMQDFPLTITSILRYGTAIHPGRVVITATDDGFREISYGEFGDRVAQLANGLCRLGVRPGDRVATFMWNNQEHFEAYFAIPCMGAVLHTLNIRLSDEQIEFVAYDAEDRVVIVDPKKRRIVWQYGHLARPGRGGGFLRTPDGMDFVPLGPHEKPLWQLVHHP